MMVYSAYGCAADYVSSNYIFSDTCEVSVFDHGAQVIGADGHPITLVNQRNASDVTKADVINFILKDNTDKHSYTSSFQCGDFAEQVHNNAETAGIKCGFVVIDPINHACNVFNTTDCGLIFIDCTHGYTDGFYDFNRDSWDSIVAMKAGTNYKPEALEGNNKYESLGIIDSYYITW